MTKTFEIYFADLTSDTQVALMEEFSTTEEDENWETIPLAVIEREDEDEDPSNQ